MVHEIKTEVNKSHTHVCRYLYVHMMSACSGLTGGAVPGAEGGCDRVPRCRCRTDVAPLGKESWPKEAGQIIRKAKKGGYYTILYYTILYYTILYYTILYYTILYYTILYYTILYYTILYYSIGNVVCDTVRVPNHPAIYPPLGASVSEIRACISQDLCGRKGPQYVCIYIYIHIYVYVFVYLFFIHTYTCTYTSTYTEICIYYSFIGNTGPQKWQSFRPAVPTIVPSDKPAWNWAMLYVAFLGLSRCPPIFIQTKI